MPAGRPRKYNSVEEMEAIIEEFFDEMEEKGLIPTVTGLALALNMTRRGLLDYEARDEFAHAIKRAKQRVEFHVEQVLVNGRNAAGPIFNLVNNFGWENRSRYEHTGKDGGPIELDDSERSARLTALLDAARTRRDGQATDDEAVGTPERAPDGSLLQ